MRFQGWIAVICTCVSASAGAKTPDGEPPSVETVCDVFEGAAFGLCNAYCEAMDCTDPNQHANDRACEQVKTRFQLRTGEESLPCEDAGPGGCFADCDGLEVGCEEWLEAVCIPYDQEEIECPWQACNSGEVPEECSVDYVSEGNLEQVPWLLVVTYLDPCGTVLGE